MNSNYEVELIEELTAMFPWLDCDPDDFGGYFDDDDDDYSENWQ